MENEQSSEKQLDATRRKRLPDIPPEELAKGQSDVGIKPKDLPPEVQAQFRRRQFRSSAHKRSRSLTGLDAIETYQEEERKLAEESRHAEIAPSNNDDLENAARSLPNTPVIKRRSSDSMQASKDSKDQEILKELRWHYKQYVRASKRKKDKTGAAGVDAEARVLSAVEVVLNEASQTEDKPSAIHTNRCDRCTKSVEILERVAVENHIFHKSCFLCAICNTWLNYFNYCFVPDHDKFYCVQHYQDIENASAGLGEEIRHAMGIGPGVQQQFNFTPDTKTESKDGKSSTNGVQKSLKIMKEKISLLSKRGKKLEKKAVKLKKEYLKLKGSDAERRKMFYAWFDTETEKNSTVRREAELTFKIRETELSEKYLDLEKRLREISEKSENTKTEYDKSKEKELLQEMLVVVEKREQLISEMDEAKHRYIQEDKDLEKEKKDIGINRPDLIKDTTAADKEAQKVNEVVKKAPLTVKKQSQFMCPACAIL